MNDESFLPQGEPTSQDTTTTTLDNSPFDTDQTPMPITEEALTDREIVQETEDNPSSEQVAQEVVIQDQQSPSPQEETVATPQNQQAPSSPEESTTAPKQETTQRPNVILHKEDGEEVNFASDLAKDNQINRDTGEQLSQVSHIASATTQFETGDGPQLPPKTERVDEETRKIVGGINTRAGEKPSELANSVKKSPDADKLQEASEKYKKDRSNLDDADLLGMKQVDQGAHHTAEIVKINKYLKEIDENLKAFDKTLRKGRELEEDEIEVLKDSYLEALPRYAEFKDEYASKNLTDEDKEILLNAHFSKEISEFEESLKDEDGNFSSENCTIPQLSILYEREQERSLEEYESEKSRLVKAHVQDRTAREEQRADSDRARREEEYKQWFEETYNIPWSVEAAKLMQERELLRNENELLHEDRAKTTKPEEDDIVTPPPLEEDEEEEEEEGEEGGGEKMEKRKKERDYKKIALIAAGVVAGGATGIVGGIPAVQVAGLAVGITRLGTLVTDKLSAHNINYLQNELKKERDAERKAFLQERLTKWNKVVKVTQKINQFLTGATVGLFGSSLVSGIFMGGKGIAEALASRREAAALEAANTGTPPTDAGQPAGEVTAEAPTAEPVTSGSIETPQTSGSIQTNPVAEGTMTSPYEGLPIEGDTLNVTELGWNWKELGFKGNRITLGNRGGIDGVFNERFFSELTKYVSTEQMQGPDAGRVITQWLREAVSQRMDPSAAAQSAAQALSGN